jgi:hypothetical protein
MIDFDKIPNSLPKEISDTRNSGIVLSWMLSKIFNFSFDLLDFYKIIKYDSANGIKIDNIIRYTNSKGLYFYDFPQNSSVNANFYKSKDAGIATAIAYSAYGKDKCAHMSLIESISGTKFSMLYGNPNYTDLTQISGLYMFFITRLHDISDYIKTLSPLVTKLSRYPEYGQNL